MNAKVDPARLEAIREKTSLGQAKRQADAVTRGIFTLEEAIFIAEQRTWAARAERDAAWANEQITRDQRDWAIVAAVVFALLWAGPWLLSWFR
jgi:hypothetical protein